jgi:O-methyltransferase
MHRGLAGDFAEIGVWRGGAGILLRAIVRAFDDRRRKIWLADSFEGLPQPDAERYPADQNDEHWKAAELAVPLETVRRNFERYGLLDDQDQFLKGWFRDTLPTAPIKRLSLLHLDCDMYESTILALRSLYSLIIPGGYVIVDDYGAVPACRQAVTDFRLELQIQSELRQIDWTAVFWQVQGETLSSQSNRNRGADASAKTV